MGEDGSGVGGEVGTIVWVRRRNGSWWPGRILGQHELSASHLMSPRSGTPVKLLGREDASVDWYNLEKSKRVKAFRCGEFDACIEKAEAAQGIPIKKREKYARREDAIIHALELERQMLEGRSLKLGGGLTNQHSGALEESIDFPSEVHIMTDGTDGTSGSGKHSKCRKVGLPVALTAKGNLLSTDAGVVGSLYVNDYGASDMAPRMRGLQDFGLQAASSKRKMTSSGSYESCKKSFLMDNHEDSQPRSTRDVDGWYNLGNKKSSSPLKNRKFMSGLNEETKRRDRRRPLLQVLQSSAKLKGSPTIYNGYDSMKVWPNHFGYNNYLEEENAFSGIIDPYDPELPEKLGLDPEMEHEEPLISSTSPFVHELIDLGRNEEYGRGAVLLNDQDGCANRNTTSLYGRPFDDTLDGVSRWNLKGKRNTRKLSKKSLHLDAERSIYHEGGVRSLHQGLYTGDSDDSDSVEKDLELDLGPADKVGFQPNFQRSFMDDVDHSMDDSDKESGGMSVSTWDGDRLHHAPRRRQWDDLHQQFSHAYTGRFRDRIESGLVDVNLEVQASYQGERVPLVSLMSRLNGKAIIGHPLQVETLSDGFTDMLLPENDSGGNPSQSFGTATQPVWRTGRRTSLPRIPRPHATSAMEGRGGILHSADFDSRNNAKRLLPVHYDEARLAKKKSHSQRPTKKSHKKSSKKASLSNLKTRTLSSLSKGQKNASGKPSSKVSPLNILMKPGDTVPMATCIPVKVAFSRILEAVGRSPSHAAVHRHLSTVIGLDGRKPS